ncbi:hypothetical protein H4R35_007108, partial [Dimargaris xerosporica]
MNPNPASASSPAAAASAFWTEFQATKAQLTDRIAQLQRAVATNPRSQLHTSLQGLFQDVVLLEGRVTQALVYLPPYDERSYKVQLQELKDAIKTLKEQIAPRPRFGFSRRHASAAPTPASRSSTTAPSPAPPAQDHLLVTSSSPLGTPDHSNSGSEAALVVQDVQDSVRILEPMPISSASSSSPTVCKVQRCRNAVINLVPTQGNIRSLHLTQLTRCVILAGPVDGSVYLEHCTQCVLLVACRQIRMHLSQAITLYVHVTSHPIIEDCHNIRVAPYPTALVPTEQASQPNPSLVQAIPAPLRAELSAGWVRAQL